MWCGRADIPGCPAPRSETSGAPSHSFMISWPPQNFRVEVDGIGTCRVLYVVAQGGMENDYVTVCREDGGRWLTARIDQLACAENPTLDILGADPA